jgi:flavodoxin I
MKTLVVYDSVFGNTEKIATQIAQSLQAESVQLSKVDASMLTGVELLVIGSPTRAFKPTPNMTTWVEGLISSQLGQVKVAVFDTRIDTRATKNLMMRFVDMMGYAAPWMQKKLTSIGLQVVKPAEGFYVEASEGPLKAGELERAAAWATLLLS